MNFKSILLLLILVVTELISGQSFTLKGKVTDVKTNSPIQGAVVFISYNYMTYTNGDGEYILNELSEGTYDIKISCHFKSICIRITPNPRQIIIARTTGNSSTRIRNYRAIFNNAVITVYVHTIEIVTSINIAKITTT